jgi:hypothetical protein
MWSSGEERETPILLGYLKRANLYHWATHFKSQSHVTTDDQSVSMSWCQVHSGTRDQMLYSV